MTGDSNGMNYELLCKPIMHNSKLILPLPLPPPSTFVIGEYLFVEIYMYAANQSMDHEPLRQATTIDFVMSQVPVQQVYNMSNLCKIINTSFKPRRSKLTRKSCCPQQVVFRKPADYKCKPADYKCKLADYKCKLVNYSLQV